MSLLRTINGNVDLYSVQLMATLNVEPKALSIVFLFDNYLIMFCFVSPHLRGTVDLPASLNF
jgi:hypothetical protein